MEEQIKKINGQIADLERDMSNHEYMLSDTNVNINSLRRWRRLHSVLIMLICIMLMMIIMKLST